MELEAADPKYNLEILTQKLMMMFLVLPQPKILSLHLAVYVVFGSNVSKKRKLLGLQRLREIV